MASEPAAVSRRVRRQSFVAALALLFVCTTAAACNPVPQVATPVPTYTIDPIHAEQVPPHRGKITALFCDDATGSYDRQYFNDAKQLIMKSFLSAVQANQDGVTLYVATINYDPVTPQSSLDPLILPAVPGYPLPPTVVPYPPTNNTFSAPKTAAVVDAANDQAIANYNASTAAVKEALKQATTTANSEVQRLQNWNPPEDDRGTSVLGCLYLVTTRLQITQDIKQVIIASDLENNVTTSLTNNFVQSQGLKGVSVHVIYLPGTITDNTKRASWCAFFHSAGASAVRMDDTSSSDTLGDLFNADLHLSPSC